MRSHRVKRGSSMTFGKNEAVATGIVEGVGPKIEFGSEQTSQKIRTRHCAAGMTGTCMIDGRDGMLAHKDRSCRKKLLEILSRSRCGFFADGSQGQCHIN